MKIYYLFFGIFALLLIAENPPIDVERMVNWIIPAGGFPDDLPDSPSEGITRNTVSVILSPGVTATYSVPDTVCAGSTFVVTASITNASGATTTYTVNTWTGLIPNTAAVTFIGATPSIGTFNPAAGSGAPCASPGIGTWSINQTLANNQTATITIHLLANTAGAITSGSSLITSAIPAGVCFAGVFTILPAPTAGTFTGTECSNTPVTGFLPASGGTPPYTFAITSFPPANTGTLTLVNATTGQILFTPNPSFSGIASFLYSVTDTNGCSASGSGNIFVNGNLQAASETITDCSSTFVTGSLVPLVSGGTPPYTFSPNGPATGGNALVFPDGTFTFNRASGFSGTASFGYRVTDSLGCTSTNTVFINFGVNLPNQYIAAYQIVYFESLCTE